MVAWLGAPARWPWLARQLNKTRWIAKALDMETRGKAGRLFQILLPAFLLSVIFGLVFGARNAVFGEIASRIGNQVLDWISELDLSINHALFCLGFATLGLACAFPRRAPAKQRPWTRGLPPIARTDSLVAVWQSRLILAALNALFCMVNTIDVFYLWNHTQLPRNVNFSQFVHEGVYSLIFAVLLSAAVIAVIFQQEARIKNARFVRGLSLLWIAQNLVLIAGVFLRLKLYVEAYQLSELRIYVGCFLLLVTVGFGLLAWHVARNGDLNTLVFRCALATFALFFILQFANVGGAVARYNVARWKHDPKRALDMEYLASLGPGAWPSLVDVASVSSDPCSPSARARAILQATACGHGGCGSPGFRHALNADCGFPVRVCRGAPRHVYALGIIAAWLRAGGMGLLASQISDT